MAGMASLKGLRAMDPLDQQGRVRYGSKGRLSSTLVLGEPGGERVFVPVTLAPTRKGGSAPLGALQRRFVGAAEVATLTRSASAGAEGWSSASDRKPSYVSLGHTVRLAEPDHCEGDDNAGGPKALRWYADSGLHSDSFPLSVHRSTFVNHSARFEELKPPKTYRDIEKEMHAKRVREGSGPFTANSTSRLSFVDHSAHRDRVWVQARPPRYELPPAGAPKDRAALTSSGGFRGWSAEEMARARGTATFTAQHACIEQLAGPRPATVGRHQHYFQQE